MDSRKKLRAVVVLSALAAAALLVGAADVPAPATPPAPAPAASATTPAPAPSAPAAASPAPAVPAAAAPAAAVPETAPIPPDAVSAEEVPGIIRALYDAAKEKNWSLFVGLLLTLIVFVVRTFVWKAIPSKALPWVAAALGMVASLAAALATGQKILPALWSALVVGSFAMAFWAAVFKNIVELVQKKKDKPN